MKNENINKKTRKLKSSVKYGIIILIILIIFLVLLLLIKNNKKNTKDEDLFTIDNISLVDGKIKIEIDKNKNFWCMASTESNEPKADSEKWISSKNNICEVDIDEGSYYFFIKTDDNKIIKIDETTKLGSIETFKLTTEKIYLAVNSSQKLNIELNSYGNIDKNITYEIDNEEVASINDEGIITGKKDGKTTVYATLATGEKVSADVTVTSLIVNMPQTYDFRKSKLSCYRYTTDEAHLLDEILFSRIDEAGYQTRAGVVAAIRFLMFEFPYRINYYSENGRLTGFRKADGEGRYYHRGLYLSDDKFEGITIKDYGPVIWGCPLYSYLSDKKLNNGLDCSGFVTWTLINGGFDVGDVGAGPTDGVLDLTDFGEFTYLTDEVIYSDKIKAGDLIGYDGHIAIVAGIDEDYIYVAEALWMADVFGVTVTQYHKSEINQTLDYVMLMDSYYKEDGNYTAMWY